MKIKHFNISTAKAIGLVLTSLTLSLATTGIASASNLRTGFDSNTLARNDDESTGPIDLGFTANFFGNTATGVNIYNQVYVNNNGNFTFGSSLSEYTPFGLTTNTSIPIIAAFFADVDTRNLSTSPVTYGQGTVNGRNAFGANYTNVGYYDTKADKINDFQLVLIDRSDTGAGNFDIEFNYDRIQWETGDVSGGTNGLGGSSARIGYSNGTGNAGTFFELCGSGVNGAFLDGAARVSCGGELNPNALAFSSALPSTSSFAALAGSTLSENLTGSSGIGGSGGVVRFNARGGGVAIEDPTEPTSTSPTTAVPEPFTIIGTMIGGTAALRMRKKLKSNDKV